MDGRQQAEGDPVSDEPRSVAEARARADHARAQFLATFDDLLGAFKRLQQRLEPSHLAKDAWDAAKAKGADLAEDAVDAVAKRPIATTGVVAAIAMFLAREPLLDLAGKLIGGDPAKKRTPKKRAKAKTQKQTETAQ
jgi:hypothetical protein